MVKEISIAKARDTIQNKIVYQYELTNEDRLNEKYECIECNQRLRVRTNKNKLELERLLNLIYFTWYITPCIGFLDNNALIKSKYIQFKIV